MNKQANYLAEQLVLEGLIKLASFEPSRDYGEVYKDFFDKARPEDVDKIFKTIDDNDKIIQDADEQIAKIDFWNLPQLANERSKQTRAIFDNALTSGFGIPLLDKFHLTDYGRSPVHEFIRDKIPGPSWAAYGAAGAALGAATTAGIIAAVNHVREKKEAERQQRMMLESAEEP